MKFEKILDVKNILGEGPLWSFSEQALYWVDIVGQKISRYKPKTGDIQIFPQDEQISVIGFREKGGFIAAGENGFVFWSPQENKLQSIADPEPGKENARFNDGKVDRAGRFWAGTMTPSGATSALYRMDPDLQYQVMAQGITISNGIGWSPDNRYMYYVDSLRYTIYLYDFKIETGEIKNRQVFIQFSPDFGTPDGLTIDSAGNIWCAFWGGSKVVCFSPSGVVEEVISLPVTQPSSCAFGGEEMRDLFITSARDGLSESALADQPHAGDIFIVRMDVPGLPEPGFAG